MAKIPYGVFSPPAGKIGNLTVTSWKGRSVLRGLPCKYKSDSPKQEAHREDFKIVSGFAKALPAELLNRFWKYYDINDTARNNWIKSSFKIGFPSIQPQYFFTCRGKLELAKNAWNSTYYPLTGQLRLRQPADTYGNGKSTDNIFATIFYSTPYPSIFWYDDTSTRSVQYWWFSLPVGLDPNHIGVYYHAYRGEGLKQLQSNSNYQSVVGI